MDINHPTVRLIRAVGLAAYRGNSNGIHGLAHWDRVFNNAMTLHSAAVHHSRELPADFAVMAAWFAFTHDCRRHHDNDDPQHGFRARAFLARMRETFAVHELASLDSNSFFALLYAVEHHNAGYVDPGPKTLKEYRYAIKLLWDADRLDLDRPRVAIKIDPDRLCTAEARTLLRQRTLSVKES